MTSEKVGDGRMLQSLVEEASTKARITKTIGDGAYDTKSNFRYLAGKGIGHVIRVRRNSSRRARGCMARKRVVVEYLNDPEAWKRKHDYGQRWMAETVFSSYKRAFERIRLRQETGKHG